MCKKIVENYENISDDRLIYSIRENDQIAFEVLFNRYLPLIRRIIANSTCNHGDFDDMLQDATISFYYAVQMFDFHSASFRTFLSVCVERSLKSTIRKASAKKRIPDELIISIDENNDFHFKTPSAEEEYFLKSDSSNTSNWFKNRLSELEFKVLKSFIETGNYNKTAEDLGLTRKSVDNALVRIRRKLNS